MIHFIGAGPGAPDLLTLRGRDLIARSPVCLYAGSLVPEQILAYAPPGASIVDTSQMTLDEIVAAMVQADTRGEDVARLHSGDLSIWSAMAEQMRRLDACGVAYDVTPGVPAFAACAAVLGQELTLPGVAQTVILTRTATRSTPMPEGEDLVTLGKTGALLAIHLSIANIERVVEDLLPLYGGECPAAVVFRASWPDQRVLLGTLGEIAAMVAESSIERSAVIFVGRSIGGADGPMRGRSAAFAESYLYSAGRERTT